VIYAHDAKKTFNYDRLRYKTEAYKIPTYGVCTYTVKNPPGGYSGGKTYIQFNKISQGGVTLHFTSNGGVPETTLKVKSD